MVVSVVQNGLRVLTVCTLCAALAWSTETLGRVILRKGFGSGLRSLSIGLIIAMLRFRFGCRPPQRFAVCFLLMYCCGPITAAYL